MGEGSGKNSGILKITKTIGTTEHLASCRIKIKSWSTEE
jgi:hypothetical protein